MRSRGGVIVLAVATAIMLPAACGTVVTSGTVDGKRVVAAHFSLSPAGEITWVKTAWQVRVRSANGAEKWFTVTEKQYSSIQDGSTWNTGA